MKIMIIGSTEYQYTRIADHARLLRLAGHEVYIPAFDDHENLNDLEICEHNREMMQKVDEIHVIWNQRSLGTLFDFGMAFAMRKPIRIIYIEKKTFKGVMEKYEQQAI